MIHIFSPKNKIKSLPLKRLKEPVSLGLSIPKNAKSIIQKGDYIKKYQRIAESINRFGSNLHSPISGVIDHISDDRITVRNDYKNTVEQNNKIDLTSITRNSFVQILADYGIVGAGGAMFPTHVKYDIGDKPVKTLIINAAECEPYLTSDFILLQNKFEKILQTITLISTIFQIENVYIGIEKVHKNIKAQIEDQISKSDTNASIKIKWLPDSYPQGGELQLIQSITGIELKRGVLPIEQGVIVNNIGTIYAIYNAFFEGIPFIERIVTIAGDGITKQGNYIIPIGMSIYDIKEELFASIQLEDYNIIGGGPMMGKVITDIHTTIKKGNGGLLFLKKQKIDDYNCIKCGDCINACPMNLMPLNFVTDYYKKDPTAYQEDRITDCIECGACAYVCPSNIPLIDAILYGKNELKRVHV